MRYGPRLALLCLLLLAVAAPLAAVGPTAAGTVQETNGTLAPESTTLTVQLRTDGDARWTVSTAFVLRDGNDSRAFDRLAADFEAGNADVVYDATAFESAAAAASDETGRAMSIEDVGYAADRNTTDNVTVGRLSMSFEWTNFTEESGTRLRVGDAFNTSDGTWLPGLTSRQTLVVRPPAGYSVETAPVAPRDGVLRWEGPRSFEPGYLGDIVYTGETPTETATPSPTPNGPNEGGLGPLELVGGGLLVLAAFALGGYALARRDGDPFGGATDDDTPDGGAGAAATGGNDDGGTAAAAATGAVADDEPDFDLLSDEERVEYLLERNGGRMKQATIVEETGWSNAKVSQLLSAMDEAGRVNKLRIGRENLISLPGEDVAELGTDRD
ncbi:helix-turn-helix transcriptional regulator [Halosegnis marinus]|uniref:Helix-turn-helix transcriptional regulator n=1 Tax=Halosegnis marinus TaxID=3034023 RepID=A0ABD5ZP18_9EURY|nr:hypothetical protein [Halosegnis sp. DT85]